MTITEFILARVEEDEAAARRARSAVSYRSGEWHADDADDEAPWLENGVYTYDVHHGSAFFATRLPQGASTHIARHDPARVLAECESKRRIVGLHTVDHRDDRDICAECGPEEDVRFQVDHYDRGWPCPTLRALAAVWADHPDYQPAWKVQQ